MIIRIPASGFLLIILHHFLQIALSLNLHLLLDFYRSANHLLIIFSTKVKRQTAL
jgi:hypothetical protein